MHMPAALDEWHWRCDSKYDVTGSIPSRSGRISTSAKCENAGVFTFLVVKINPVSPTMACCIIMSGFSHVKTPDCCYDVGSKPSGGGHGERFMFLYPTAMVKLGMARWTHDKHTSMRTIIVSVTEWTDGRMKKVNPPSTMKLLS